MSGNGKVFISHVHEDNERCKPITAMLDAWGVDYWFDLQQLGAGQQISERVQGALASHDIFMQIGSGAANRSMWIPLELQAFRGLQANDRRARTVITLILDKEFVPSQAQPGDFIVDLTSGDKQKWIADLRLALGVKPPVRPLSRRAVITAGVVTTAAIVGASALAALKLTRAGGPGVVVPSTHAAAPTPFAGSDRVVWSYTFDGTPEGVLVSNGTVYVGQSFGTTLTALNATTGDYLWGIAQPRPALDAAPALAGGNIVLCDESGRLVALNTADGTAQWAARLGASSATTPCVTASALFVNSGDGSIYAFNPSSGAQLWRTPFQTSTYLSLSTPVVTDGVVICSSEDGVLYGFSQSTGAKLWTRSLTSKPSTGLSATNGLLHVGVEKTLYALDAHTGATRQSTAIEGVSGTPVVNNEVVYVGSNMSYLYALKQADLSVIWKGATGTSVSSSGYVLGGDPVTCEPAIGNASVYATSGTALWAFDLSTGKQQWRVDTPQSFLLGSKPIISNGMVYFTGNNSNNTLYAVRA